MIQHQIKGREQQRLLDAEKKDQETQAMLKYLERLQEEDMENLQKKRQSQKQLMEEVAQCNEVIYIHVAVSCLLILSKLMCLVLGPLLETKCRHMWQVGIIQTLHIILYAKESQKTQLAVPINP